MEEKGVVLIAEDLETDILLYKRAFRLAAVSNPIRFVSNGEEVVNYMCGSGGFCDRRTNPIPSLILLDLKMHKMDGLETLRWLRNSSQFSDIPVIVVSSSLLPRDEEQALTFGANGFFAKTIGFAGLIDRIRETTGIWTEESKIVGANAGS